MQKVRLLQDFGVFKKDTCKVIMAQDNEYYYVQHNLYTTDIVPFSKKDNGILFQVVERS